ncbi:MAG: ABC transporter ATP-binding protein [Oscillospiraceae bacterium]|nr:ABC transporter ATP-binding protein [Oscillospiraceae bacterium]
MIKRLLPFLKGYRKPAVLAPLSVIIETVCELCLPLLMAAIIDDGIQKGNMTVVWQSGLLMLLVSAISLTGGTLGAKFTAEAAQGLGANIRQAEFDKINEFSFADIDRFSSASLITRLTNDVNQVQMVVSICLRSLFRSGTMVVVAMIAAFSISPRLASCVFLILPVVAAVLLLLMKICGPLFRNLQKKIDAMNQVVQENLIAIRVVKAFVREDHEKKKFNEANDNLTNAGIKAVMRMMLMGPVMTLGMGTATALILYNGGNLVVAGGLEVGDLSSIITYIMNILFSAMMLGMALFQYTRARASADRIFEVLDCVPSIRDKEDLAGKEAAETRGKVEFKNVSFKYQASGTGDDVLRDINFTAQPGQVIAIVGGTGSGKSTLVNLIPRFYDVTGGQVLIDGKDVRDYKLEDLRKKVGMVLQKNVLFSGTIRENLMWGDEEATEEEIIQAAKNAQAYDFVMSFPDGFDTYIEQGGVNVSGGQKQRLCIARAMLRKPEVLILDDSTSAVDSATEALIRQSFRDNLKGTTVFLIAQRISSVKDADQIIVLEDDTIAAMGTHEQLMAESSIYQEIYYSQQEGGNING